MDGERITRRVKPLLAISTTVTIKRWVEEEARRRATSQAEVVNGLILHAMEKAEGAVLVDEREAVPA